MKNENTNMNIPELSVNDVIGELLDMYDGAIGGRIPFRCLPSPFLWGPPGIGKSDAIRQLGEALEEDGDIRVCITDVRLLLFSPVDLRGVPVADVQKQLAVWLKPAIFQMDPSDNVVNILLLDELSAAPQSVQSAAYQLTLDRRIGEHKLPENCIVIAAGNRTTDQSVAYKMPKALANRMMHFNVRSDFASWKQWAIQNGIDKRIIGFLSFDNSGLYREPDPSDLAYPTPRSWTFVSTVLRALGRCYSLETAHNSIAACVGTDMAVAFETWCQVYEKLPDTESILGGTCREYPKTQDVLYALSASLLVIVRERWKILSQTELENICEYAARFPADFAMTFFKDLQSIQINGLHLRLMKCRSLQAWLAQNRKYL